MLPKKATSKRHIVGYVCGFLAYAICLAYVADYISSVHDFDALGRIKSVCKLLSYVGIGLTTALSTYSLTRRTVTEPTGASDKKELTRTGQKYLMFLVCSVLLTVFVSVVNDRVDANIKDIVNDKAQDALIAKFKPHLKELQDATDLAIKKETDKLDGLGGVLDSTVTDVKDVQSQVNAFGAEFTVRTKHIARDQSLASRPTRSVGIDIFLMGADGKRPVRFQEASTMAHHLQSAEAEECGKALAAKEKLAQMNVPEGEDESVSAPQAQSSTSDTPQELDVKLKQTLCQIANQYQKEWDLVSNVMYRLDPQNHFDSTLQFGLQGFWGGIGIMKDSPSGKPIIYSFENANRKYDSDAADEAPEQKLTDPPHLDKSRFGPGILAWINVKNKAFKGGPRPGEDSDLRSFGYLICDNHKNKESAEEMLKHIKSAVIVERWGLDVIITDVDGNVFDKDYVVTRSKAAPIVEESVLGRCLRINYDIY